MLLNLTIIVIAVTLLVDYNRSSVTVFASKSTRTNDDTDYTDGEYDVSNDHDSDDNSSESATKMGDDQNRHHNRNQHKNPSFLSSLLLQLNDGNYIPQVGLGVALTGSKTYNAVSFALRLGYRLFDTASEKSYNNEDQVGTAINDFYYYSNNNINNNKYNSEKANDEASLDNNIFVTTKLWDDDHGFYNTIKAFMISYRELNLKNVGSDSTITTEKRRQQQQQQQPINMYLLHSPFGGRIVETYDAMLYIQKMAPDKLKSIGVSNFGIRHLEVLRVNNRPMPTINQIEMHPLVYQQRKELIEYCHQHNIQIQAFGSLLHGYLDKYKPTFLMDMVLRYNTRGIKYNVYNGNDNDNNVKDDNNSTFITTANILLQWAIQHKFAIIPKSSHTKRIQNNVRYIKLFDQQQQHNNGISTSRSTTASTTTSIDFILSGNDMKLLDEWGGITVPNQQRNIYKKEWNWNPIDEAPVHIGRTHYFNNNNTNNEYFSNIDESKVNLLDFDFEYNDDEDYDDDGYFHNNQHFHIDDDNDRVNDNELYDDGDNDDERYAAYDEDDDDDDDDDDDE